MTIHLKIFGLEASAEIEAEFSASAATVGVSAVVSGNDCSRVFTSANGFNFCDIGYPFWTPEDDDDEFDYEADGISRVIVKFDPTDDGWFTVAPEDDGDAINSDAFPTISGGEFSFGDPNNDPLGNGSWTYTPEEDDPLNVVRFWAAKRGNQFRLHWVADQVSADQVANCEGDSEDNFNVDCLNLALGVSSGEWLSPSNNGNDGGDISHLTFYNGDEEVPPVPLPAAGWMLLAGVGGLAAMRRRRKA